MLVAALVQVRVAELLVGVLNTPRVGSVQNTCCIVSLYGVVDADDPEETTIIYVVSASNGIEDILAPPAELEVTTAPFKHPVVA